MLAVLTAAHMVVGSYVAALSLVLPASVMFEAGEGMGMKKGHDIDIAISNTQTIQAAERAFYVGVSQIAHKNIGKQPTNPANVPTSSATQTLTGGDFNQDSRLSASTPIAPNAGNWDPRASVSNTWFNNKIDQTGQNAGITYGGRSGFDEQYGNHVHDANRSDGLSNIYNNKKLDANLEKDKQNDVINGKESGFVFDGELIQQ
jgi:hypothetical protein